MHRARKSRKIVIGSLLCLLLIMSVGYAVFQSRLEIKGSSKITSNWDVRITNVTQGTVTGDAENASAPTWTDLTANMEANLYEKGAKVEYDVTISNRGTFDAKLDNIVTTPSSNEAVIITFSGYTKGEKLAKGQDKIIHVTIEYNPNYNGTAEVSGTSVVEFNYVQDEGYPLDPVPERYLLTYNYGENGGTSTNAENEYIDEGTVVNLQDKVATKPGYTFVGWNTDKTKHKGQNTTTMTADTTLYAIFKKEVTITYEKDNGVQSVGKNEDELTFWNNEPTAITLPSITLADSDYSEVLGWYDGDTKVGDAGDTYEATNSVILTAKSKVLPIMRKWDSNGNYLNTIDFHDSQNRANITTIEFKDSITAPETATKWDVSAAGNGSVIAWLSSDGKTLYIGGDGGVIAPNNMGHAFQDFTALTSINLNHLDVSNTEYMYNTFSGNTSLTTVTFGNNFDTSKVTKMNNMFEGCSALTSLDLSDLNTSKVENFSWMFMDCTNLSSINFTGWDTSSATTMAGMFQNCSSLPSLNISHFNTSNVTTMRNMFAMFNSPGRLTTLNLSNFNTSKVTTMEDMFYGNSSLTSLNVSSFDTSKVTNMRQLFFGCSALTSLDLSNFNTSKVTTMEGMFQGIKNITILNLNSFDTSSLKNMHDMFNGPNAADSRLKLIYLCGANTSSVTDMVQTFVDLPQLEAVYVGNNWTEANADTTHMFGRYGTDTAYTPIATSVTKLNNCQNATETPIIQSWTQNSTTDFHAATYKSSITSVVFENHKNVPSGATSWDVSALPNTGNVMAWVVSDGNGGYVLHIGGNGGVIANENSARLFDGFTGITSINFNGNYDTSSATTMEGMFKGCSSLTSLDLSGFDTSNVTNMGAMFKGSTSLSNINLSGFNTSNATHIGSMFADCTSLTNVDLSDFDTSKVTRLDSMFTGCSNLSKLILCNFNTSIVTNMNNMFNGTTNIQTIYVGNDWTSANATTTDMFKNSNISEVTKLNNCQAATTNPIIKQWEMTAGEVDFHASSYRENITSVVFENHKNIPAGATSWDVSDIPDTENVMAWVTEDPNDNTKYVLHIGGEGGVIANPSNSSWLFHDFTALTSINFTNFDTSEADEIYGLLAGCSSLTSVDLGPLDTSNVTQMGGLFDGCSSLTSIDLSPLDTSKVTAMHYMLRGTTSLTSITFGGNFDTSKVKEMEGMFAQCGITTLDLSIFDTGNVEDMSLMFNGSSITDLNLSGFDTSKVTNMGWMFDYSAVKVLKLCSFDTNSVTTMERMFGNMRNIQAIYVGSNWTEANATTTNMFQNSNVSAVTKLDYCQDIEGKSTIKKWGAADTTDFHADPYRQNITSVDFLSTIDIPTGATSWDVSEAGDGNVMAWVVPDGSNYKLYIAQDGGVIANPDSSRIFYYFPKLNEVNFNNNFDTSTANSIAYMFAGGNNITSIDLSSFDTSKVVTVAGMFSAWNGQQLNGTWGNRTITEINGLENFDTSNMVTLADMFSGQPIKTLNLSSFDTSKVTTTFHMFNGCDQLTTVYASDNFVVTNNTNSTLMFGSCYKIMGGNGTRYNASYLDKTYAKIDKTGQAGYFTDGSDPAIIDVATTSTATTLTVAVAAIVPDGSDEIVTYEYSIDDGNTWVSSNTNTYTFTGLTKNTDYPLKIRVTTEGGNQATWTKDSLDKEVPVNSLLYWGQASNPANTSTILKNKVSGTDGTLTNFNNNASSGYNGMDLIFDGSNDYVDLGRANYNFNKTQSYLLYVKIPKNNSSTYKSLIGNWESAGSGIEHLANNTLSYAVYDGSTYKSAVSSTINNDKYCTIIGTYDGTTLRLYVDGVQISTAAASNMTVSPVKIMIGANPNASSTSNYAQMNMREAMLFDRALTADEVASITSTLQKKYSFATEDLDKVTYSQTDSGTTATVTMTFPEECGSTYTCSYTKDGGSPVTVTSTTVTESFAGAGTLEGTIVSPEGTSTTTYNAAVKYTVNYVKGSNVSSIGATSGSCNLAAGATSCTVTLPSITANTGYSSVGWNTSSGATTGTAAGGTLTLTQTGLTRYANAKANTYSISYNLNSGSYGSSHPTSATYNSAFTVNNPSRSGYTFSGWTISGMDSTTHYFGSATSTATSSSGRKETSFKNLRSTSGTVTFTAVWAQNKVTITSSKSTDNTNGYKSCSGSWNNNKYQYTINYNGSSVSSGKMCYASSNGGSTSGCKNYASSGETGYGTACFTSATSWQYYRSSGCTYAYAKAANGASASKYQC